MNILLMLVPVALALGFAGLVAFVWSLRAGQYDDLDGAASRVLFDDDISDRTPEIAERKPSRPDRSA
jgi:cbb3-type cytochrome oxidase maturation protein